MDETCMTDLPNWLILVLVILGTFFWKIIGVVAAGKIRDDSEVLEWVSCVAFAITAGIMIKVLMASSGILAEAPLLARFCGVAFGVTAFFLSDRKIFVGLGVGLSVFAALSYLNLSWPIY
jgi:hypothetical protein